MERRDVTAPRTLNDLELRHGFGKSFAELMGVSNDARILAEHAEETATKADEKATEAITKVVGPNGIVATLGLRYDDALQKSVIEIRGNTLYITTDKFSLTGDGTITATGGYIGGWSIGTEGIFKSFLGLAPDEEPDSLNFVSSTFFIAPPINYQTSHVIRLEMNRKEVFHVLSNGEIFATSGSIGGVSIGDGLNTSNNDGEVSISNGKIQSSAFSVERSTVIENGFIVSNNNTTDNNVIMVHNAGGTRYKICIENGYVVAKT